VGRLDVRENIQAVLFYIRKIGVKNEVGFKCQRSLLQVPMKPASLGIEAGFIFLRCFPHFFCVV